jgi:hypothetical protein
MYGGRRYFAATPTAFQLMDEHFPPPMVPAHVIVLDFLTASYIFHCTLRAVIEAIIPVLGGAEIATTPRRLPIVVCTTQTMQY